VGLRKESAFSERIPAAIENDRWYPLRPANGMIVAERAFGELRKIGRLTNGGRFLA
jgi:hypothetical protein